MNAGRRTLVVLTPGFAKDEDDSSCLPFIRSFIKTLAEENQQLQVFVLAFQYPYTTVSYRLHGAKVIPFNGQNKGKLNRLTVWLKVYRHLKKIIRANHVIGILNLWLGECAVVGHYAARKNKLPVYTWLMGQDARRGNRHIALAKPNAAEVIALSDFLSAELYRNYKIRPAHVIQPGIDERTFNAYNWERDIDIIGAGSLIPLKRFDIFIRIVEQLRKKYPGIKTVICGDGPEREHLSEQIKQAGLSANIELRGEITHAEVLQLMQRSKILLHPSSYEGFGLVYAEALYAGAHTIGFTQPMNELFHQQHVVKDEMEMLRRAEEILGDQQTQYRSVITCTIQETARKILSLYN